MTIPGPPTMMKAGRALSTRIGDDSPNENADEDDTDEESVGRAVPAGEGTS